MPGRSLGEWLDFEYVDPHCCTVDSFYILGPSHAKDLIANSPFLASYRIFVAPFSQEKRWQCPSYDSIDVRSMNGIVSLDGIVGVRQYDARLIVHDFDHFKIAAIKYPLLPSAKAVAVQTVLLLFFRGRGLLGCFRLRCFAWSGRRYGFFRHAFQPPVLPDRRS